MSRSKSHALALKGASDHRNDVPAVSNKLEDATSAAPGNLKIKLKYSPFFFDESRRPQERFVVSDYAERLEVFDSIDFCFTPLLGKLRHGSPPQTIIVHPSQVVSLRLQSESSVTSEIAAYPQRIGSTCRTRDERVGA